jgi:hypothetical protein
MAVVNKFVEFGELGADFHVASLKQCPRCNKAPTFFLKLEVSLLSYEELVVVRVGDL